MLRHGPHSHHPMLLSVLLFLASGCRSEDPVVQVRASLPAQETRASSALPSPEVWAQPSEPQDILVGHWELDEAATREANANTGTSVRKKMDGKLKTMDSLVVSYQKDGQVITRSSYFEHKARWKVDKVEGMSLDVHVSEAKGPRTTTRITVLDDAHIVVANEGVSLVLKRAYNLPRAMPIPQREQEEAEPADRRTRSNRVQFMPQSGTGRRSPREGDVNAPSTDPNCESQRTSCLSQCGVRDAPCITQCHARFHCSSTAPSLYVR